MDAGEARSWLAPRLSREIAEERMLNFCPPNPDLYRTESPFLRRHASSPASGLQLPPAGCAPSGPSIVEKNWPQLPAHSKSRSQCSQQRYCASFDIGDRRRPASQRRPLRGVDHSHRRYGWKGIRDRHGVCAQRYQVSRHRRACMHAHVVGVVVGHACTCVHSCIRAGAKTLSFYTSRPWSPGPRTWSSAASSANRS